MNYAEHIQELSKRYRIQIEFYDGPYKHAEAFTNRRIRIPHVTTPARYSVALHEIGHFQSRNLSHPLMFKEGAAWHWAKQHARVWLPSMQQAMLRSLRYYLHRITTDDAALQARWKWPPRSHPFWHLMHDEPDVRALLNAKLPSWLHPEQIHIPWNPILTHPDRPRCSNCAYWQDIVTFETNDVPEKRTFGICVNKDRPLGVELTPAGALCGLSYIRKVR